MNNAGISNVLILTSQPNGLWVFFMFFFFLVFSLALRVDAYNV